MTDPDTRLAAPLPDFGHGMRELFLLEDGIAYLNHGGYGATPRPVLEAAERWRRRMEAQPSRFMQSELPGADGLLRRMAPTSGNAAPRQPVGGALRAAAAELATFLGARAEDVVFVGNATDGINAVVRSLRFSPGDELLTTSHVYGAVRRTLEYVCATSGARLVEAAVPFPAADADAILAAVTAALTPRTRLMVVDHVASPTALIFPVARMAAAARRHGTLVLVDGAHAVGMLDLDIPALGVDAYVGNCHKWLFGPKSCGFLWATPNLQPMLHPTAISHGYGGGFLAEFDWTGTRDPGPCLAVPAALAFLRRLETNRMRAHNHALLCEAVRLLTTAWDTEAGGPPALFGAMATVRLPLAEPADLVTAQRLHDDWWQHHRIEVPVLPIAGRLWVRISAQVYNELDDYRRLEAALPR